MAQCILSSIPKRKGLVKTASVSSESAVINAMKAFVTVLETMAASSRLSSEEMSDLNKTAGKVVGMKSKDVTVKMASTNVRDSHYFMDVSLDPIAKEGKSLIMVSCLMREGYLGRYMIKRCYYYLPDNAVEAETTYNELVRKSEGVKKRYLQGEVKPFDILPQVKAFLDGIRGDFEIKEGEVLGTTAERDRKGYHEAEGPTYIRMA